MKEQTVIQTFNNHFLGQQQVCFDQNIEFKPFLNFDKTYFKYFTLS